MQGSSKPKNFSSAACALLGRERVEIGDLGLPEHVDAVGREPAGVPGQHQPGTRHLGLRHLPVEAEIAGERLELERITPAGDELAQAQHQTDGDRGRPRAAGRVEAFSS